MQQSIGKTTARNEKRIAQQLVGQDRHERLSVENVGSRPSVDLRCCRPPTAGKVLEARNSKLIDISLATCRLIVSFEAANERWRPVSELAL